MNKITIIGAGLAGSLLSVYLAKKGFEVNVYERRPDMRKHDPGRGRSINLALSTRGIHALREVGLYDEIKKIAIPMYGRMIHSLDGSTMFQRYGKDDTEYINAVSRAELNKKLMDLAEGFEQVKFHFDNKCLGMDFNSGSGLFHNEKDGSGFTVKSDVTIATDGAASPVRMEMLKLPRFDFSQDYENYGYKELTIPPGPNGSFLMEKNALHIWPRGSFMLIALPNLDGSYTCTLFLAYDKTLGGDNSFEFLESKEKVQHFFNKNFPDAVKLMPGLIEDFFGNPTGNLITIKCFPWCVEGKSALLGDSAHAIVPFFGQGMNAAFEDCTYLNEIIDRTPLNPPFGKEGIGIDWKKIFSEYQNMRKPNADAIADLAQENFVEMRDLVAQPGFQLMKKIEAELYKLHPKKFLPKYSMVTFHRIPYSVALERGKIQQQILHELTSGVANIEQVDWVKAVSMVNSYLTDLE
jgi:kynurenine 3-monooxygenase